MIYILDTETSGFKTNHIIQFASMAINDEGEVYEKTDIKFRLPDGVEIEEGASKVHGIKTEDLKGFDLIQTEALEGIIHNLNQADVIIGHNISFDLRMIDREYNRHYFVMPKMDLAKIKEKSICTMYSTTQFCRIPAKNRAGYKWPKLQELHKILFGKNFEDAHDALADVEATWRCYSELKKRKII